MQKKLIILLFTIFSISLSFSTVLKEGVEYGRWTMDYKAALNEAKKSDYPIFLNFTGSDWCGWCKLMDKNVFSKKSWINYAKENILLVTIDFPQDPNIVPEKYKERNARISKQFGIEGYPTYIIVDSDGISELGRLGAGREKTAESFIKEVEELLVFSKRGAKKTAKKLPADISKKYLNKIDQLVKNRKKIAEWRASEPVDNTQELVNDINNLLNEYYVSQLSKDDKKRYLSLKSQYDNKHSKLQSWMQTATNTEENRRHYQKYLNELGTIQNKMDDILNKVR